MMGNSCTTTWTAYAFHGQLMHYYMDTLQKKIANVELRYKLSL